MDEVAKYAQGSEPLYAFLEPGIDPRFMLPVVMWRDHPQFVDIRHADPLTNNNIEYSEGLALRIYLIKIFWIKFNLKHNLQDCV